MCTEALRDKINFWGLSTMWHEIYVFATFAEILTDLGDLFLLFFRSQKCDENSPTVVSWCRFDENVAWLDFTRSLSVLETPHRDPVLDAASRRQELALSHWNARPATFEQKLPNMSLHRVKIWQASATSWKLCFKITRILTRRQSRLDKPNRLFGLLKMIDLRFWLWKVCYVKFSFNKKIRWPSRSHKLSMKFEVLLQTYRGHISSLPPWLFCPAEPLECLRSWTRYWAGSLEQVHWKINHFHCFQKSLRTVILHSSTTSTKNPQASSFPSLFVISHVSRTQKRGFFFDVQTGSHATSLRIGVRLRLIFLSFADALKNNKDYRSTPCKKKEAYGLTWRWGDSPGFCRLYAQRIGTSGIGQMNGFSVVMLLQMLKVPDRTIAETGK